MFQSTLQLYRQITRALSWLADFLWRQALSCLFPGFIFLSLAMTQHVRLLGFARYDVLLALCVVMQWTLWRTGIETTDEVKVICVFHGIGLCLELYKTHLGAWRYPESAWTKFAGVPLYSGFMYASVASYLCQAWRRFDLAVVAWPSPRRTLPLIVGVYGNFFTERFLPDGRWLLVLLACFTLALTRVFFTVRGRRSQMPLLPAFLLIGAGIWLAENIATYFGAWQYPNQHLAWRLVGPAKIVSWGLLVLVSFTIVAQLKHYKERAPAAANPPVPVTTGAGV